MMPEDRTLVSFLALQRETKSSADESEVNSVDVLVFRRKDGRLDSYGRSPGAQVDLSVTKGVALVYYVVANAPEGVFAGIVRESDFLESRTFLCQNSVPGLVMHGGGDTMLVNDIGTSISVGLDRYVCKVTLDRVDPAFKSRESGEVRFKGAFLLNVCASETWSGVPETVDDWFNRAAMDPCLEEPVKSLVSAADDRAVEDSEAFCPEYSFYCLPNPAEGDERVTCLVLAFAVNGNLIYYPVGIPGMEGNKWYHIRKVTLNGNGSSDPDIPLPSTELSFAIEVDPWGDPVATGDIRFDE